MARKAQPVQSLAREAGIDPDDALIALWLEGIDYAEDAGSNVRANDVARAQRILGIVPAKDRLKVAYWEQQTGSSRPELVAILSEHGVRLSPVARTLPKGSLRKISRILGAHEKSLTPTEVHQLRAPCPAPPIPWREIGPQCPEIRYLDYGDVMRIHQALVAEALETDDPIEPKGARSDDLVHSALYRPQTSHSGVRKYPTVVMAGAALFHSLTLNHAFHNGNKRTALVSLVAYLDVNSHVLTCTENELFRITLRTAKHALIEGRRGDPDEEVMVIAEWLHANFRRLHRDERPMRWHRLKARLRDSGCEFDSANVGNRINIHRTIEETKSGFLGRKKAVSKTVTTQVAWRGDTTEADSTTVRHIRRALQLDDAHGVDSEDFYRGHDIDATIQRYRRTLKRLSRI